MKAAFSQNGIGGNALRGASSAGAVGVLSTVIIGRGAEEEAASQNGIGGTSFAGVSKALSFVVIGPKAAKGSVASASSQKGVGGTSSWALSIIANMSGGVARTPLVCNLAFAFDGGDDSGDSSRKAESTALTRITFLETRKPEGFEDGDPTLLELASWGSLSSLAGMSIIVSVEFLPICSAVGAWLPLDGEAVITPFPLPDFQCLTFGADFNDGVCKMLERASSAIIVEETESADIIVEEAKSSDGIC